MINTNTSPRPWPTSFASLSGSVHAAPIVMSPSLATSMPSGPVPGTKPTETQARLLERDAYF